MSAAVSTTPESRFPLGGLLILATATFLSVTIEMIPTGLLPDMSRDLHVSEAQIGLLLTVFAYTVVLSAAPLTAITARMGRRSVVVLALSVLAVSTLLSAVAPTYELLVVARLLGGLAHGLFWSVVSAYAGYLVPRQQVGRAVSLIVSGGTLAFVLGVPLGTALGHALGWRLAFGVIAAVTALGALLVWRFVPEAVRPARAPGPDGEKPQSRRGSFWRDDTTVLTLCVCGLTAFLMIGHYAFYSYIAPYLIEVAGIPEDMLAVMLFIYGVAGAVGLLISGTLFSARVTLGLRWAILGCLVGVALMATMSGTEWLVVVGFVLWGMAFGMMPPSLQTTMLHTASERIRDTASAVYTTAFNAGIGSGALVGAVLLEAFGLVTLPWFYGGMLAVALAVSVAGIRYVHRARR